jgi:hypothetical protein
VLSNVPVIICARYLKEICRILTKDGEARIQVFLGSCQPTVEDDTVAFRSFSEENFSNALTAAGFTVEKIWPWKLDIEVAEDGWLKPMLVAIKKKETTSISEEELEKILWPGGEAVADESWPGSHVEYLLSTLRAEELAKSGKSEEALRALEYAIENYKEADPKLVSFLKSQKNSGS